MRVCLNTGISPSAVPTSIPCYPNIWMNITKHRNIQSESCGSQGSSEKQEAKPGDSDRVCPGRLGWFQWQRHNSTF